MPTPEGSHARETENQQTKLLEAQDGERLDTRATSTAGAANPPLETVGIVDGTEDAGG